MKTDYEIPLEELEIGKCYVLGARNLEIGIWDGRDFHGIREKFGDKYMFAETHWDLDNTHGTAIAIRELK
jgi:hypothetical protein